MAEPPEDIRPEFMARGQDRLSRLSAEQVHDLLVRCWISHDARWFMAVAREFGPEAASRLNKAAVKDLARVEARRLAEALELPRPRSVDDLIFIQETFIALLGPGQVDYQVIRTGEDSFQIRVERCFAHDNVVRAGVAEQYDCGIFARMTAWPLALGAELEMSPPLGRCLKVAGRDCVYDFQLK